MFFNLILKGFIIGVSFTIPGCSGGTFAVYVGVYDKLLHALGNIFKEFKKSMTFLIPIGIGLAAGIVVFSKLMALALAANSFITIMVFIGLTIGGVPNIAKNIKGKPVTTSGVLSFLFAFAIIAIMIVFQVRSGSTGVGYLTLDVMTIALLFALGFVAAITMIIPGVSGSALLLILGYYTAIVSNVVGNLLDFSAFWYNVSVLIPFGIGAVVGVISVSKLLESVLRKYPVQSYMAIIGFIIASAVILLLWIRDPATSTEYLEQTPIYQNLGIYLSTHLWTVIIGLFGLAAGILGSLQIVKFGSRPNHAER